MPVKTFGLILAAGAGTRFTAGRPKQLAELAGRPLLEHAIRAQCAVPELERVIVVLGAGAREIRAAIDFLRAEPVLCADWLAGQSASLRRGLQATSGAGRVLVTLGDQPLISPVAIGRVLASPGSARAVYEGRPGHPVLLCGAELARAAEASGDAGARLLLAGAHPVDCTGLGSDADVDTLDELRAVSGVI